MAEVKLPQSSIEHFGNCRVPVRLKLADLPFGRFQFHGELVRAHLKGIADEAKTAAWSAVLTANDELGGLKQFKAIHTHSH